MKVKHKPTGQIGTIPDDKFDPALFELVQDQTQPTQQPQQTQGMTVDQAVQEQPKKDGFIKGMAKAIVKPAVDFGNMLGGAGYEVARAGASALGDEKAYAVNPETGKAYHENPFLKEEELQDFQGSKGLVEGAKRTAGAMSYVVPVGKAASVGGKVVQGAVAGAKTGGLYGFSQSEEEGAEGLATDTVTGALTGGVTGGVVGGVGGVLSKLKGAGDATRKGVIKPKVAPSPFMADEEKIIQQILEKEGARGSAEAQKQQMPKIFNSLTSKIKDKLAETTDEISIDKISSLIDDSLDNNINYDGSIPAMAGMKDRLLNQSKTLALQSGDKTGVSLTTLFKFKQQLGNKLSRAFDKVEKGMPLTDKEEVAMAVWSSVDDIITTIRPDIKDLTKTQSYLYRAMPGIAKQADKGLSVPILGNLGTSAGRIAQSGQDLIGRGLQATGGVVNAIPGAVSNVAQKASVMNQVSNQISPDQTQDVLSTDTVTDSTQMQPPMDQGGSQPPAGIDMADEDLVVAMMQYDLQTTGGKNIPEIKQMYEIASKSGGGKLNATQQKRMGSLDQAEGVYNMVEQLALDAGTGFGAFGKALAGQLPGVEGGSEEDLQRVTEALAKSLAGALANEVGVATDRDIQRWMGLMPKVTDTMAERQRVLQRLKTEIQRAKGQISTPDGFYSGDSGIDVSSSAQY